MSIRSGSPIHTLCLVCVLVAASFAGAVSGSSWNGVLTDGPGKPVSDAIITLHAASGGRDYAATTAVNGRFAFADIAAGSYEVSVKFSDRQWKAPAPLEVKDASILTMLLQLSR